MESLHCYGNSSHFFFINYLWPTFSGSCISHLKFSSYYLLPSILPAFKIRDSFRNKYIIPQTRCHKITINVPRRDRPTFQKLILALLTKKYPPPCYKFLYTGPYCDPYPRDPQIFTVCQAHFSIIH